MLTPQTISLIVANLEKAGRLRRTVDPAHGRIQRMELTDEGRVLLDRCRERTAVIDARLRESLPDGLEAQVRRWLVEVATLELAIEKAKS